MNAQTAKEKEAKITAKSTDETRRQKNVTYKKGTQVRFSTIALRRPR